MAWVWGGMRGVGGGDEEAAGHAQVDEELRGFAVSGQVDGDGFADAVDAVDAGVR